MSQGQPVDPVLTFRRYAVVYLDLLGHKERLRQWNKLPGSKEEQEAFNENLQMTVGTVTFLRKKLVEHFDLYRRPLDPNELRRVGLTECQAATWLGIEEVQPKWTFFSDFFIFHCPLENSSGDLAIWALYLMLRASAIVMPVCLASDNPLRGGIDVGLATELPCTGDVYGPALVEAHELEAEVAKYPRIAVGKAVQDFIEDVRGSGAQDDRGIALKRIAEDCSRLICTDRDDGVPMVDFLGEYMLSFYKERQCVKTFHTIRKAIEYAKEKHERFKQQGDNEMAPRYGRLSAYCSSREHLWR